MLHISVSIQLQVGWAYSRRNSKEYPISLKAIYIYKSFGSFLREYYSTHYKETQSWTPNKSTSLVKIIGNFIQTHYTPSSNLLFTQHISCDVSICTTYKYIHKSCIETRTGKRFTAAFRAHVHMMLGGVFVRVASHHAMLINMKFKWQVWGGKEMCAKRRISTPTRLRAGGLLVTRMERARVFACVFFHTTHTL